MNKIIQVFLIEYQLKEISKSIKKAKSKTNEYLGMIAMNSNKLKSNSIQDSFEARKRSIAKECEELERFVYELAGMVILK